MSLSDENRRTLVSFELETRWNTCKDSQGCRIAAWAEICPSGVLMAEEAKFYARLQNLRERGDYNCSYNATEGIVLQMFEQAKSFVKKCESIIQLNN